MKFLLCSLSPGPEALGKTGSGTYSRWENAWLDLGLDFT